jgi:transcriptional regulator with XRE-family HTH domain
LSRILRGEILNKAIVFSAMELRKILAKNVFKRRKALNFTQEELAHRAGIDRTWVSTIETSKSGVTVDVLEKVAKALEIEAADLLRTSVDQEAG